MPCTDIDAPELRDKVYRYLPPENAYHIDTLSHSALPGLCFSQVCRQIRTEFYPMLHQEPVIIRLRNLPGYPDCFYSADGSNISNVGVAPKRVDLMLSVRVPRRWHGPSAAVDILPLIKIAQHVPGANSSAVPSVPTRKGNLHLLTLRSSHESAANGWDCTTPCSSNFSPTPTHNGSRIVSLAH